MNGRTQRGGDIAALALVVMLATPVAVVWLASLAAGELASGHALQLSLPGAIGVLVHLAGHLGAPRLAWPAADRSQLPGTVLLDAILLLVCAVVLGLVAGAACLVGRLVHRRDRDRAARWASNGELGQLRVGGPEPGRIMLGEHSDRLIATETRTSVLVVGPAQSGKSTGMIVPAVLEWQGPVLSTSVKADVVHDTHAARSQLGEVLIFDPTSSTGLQHTPWSPISASHTWAGARRTAANLLGVGDAGSAHSTDETFWRPAGARYLAPLLLAASHCELTMREVLRWVATMSEDEPTALLTECANPGAVAGLEALRSVWDADHRLRSSLMQTIATSLDAWQEPAIAAATRGESEISAQRLLAGSNTLYLIAPAHEQRRLRGLFNALVADIAAGAFERSARTGQPIDPALLLALDEAANIAPLPNLDELASTGPGQGVQLLTVLQNISQAADRWGRDRAETIIANHRARVFCSGIGDRATLDYLSSTLGEEEIARISTHRDHALATGSRTYSTDFRHLAAPHRIRQADTNSALLIYGHLAPAWISLRPWYRDRHLKALVTAESTPSATGRPGGLARRLLTRREVPPSPPGIQLATGPAAPGPAGVGEEPQ